MHMNSIIELLKHTIYISLDNLGLKNHCRIYLKHSGTRKTLSYSKTSSQERIVVFSKCCSDFITWELVVSVPPGTLKGCWWNFLWARKCLSLGDPDALEVFFRLEKHITAWDGYCSRWLAWQNDVFECMLLCSSCSLLWLSPPSHGTCLLA